MVSRVNTPMEDEDHGYAGDVKDEHELSWAELIVEGAKAIDEHGLVED